MGYTHYWQQTRDFTEAEFTEIGAAITKIIAATSIPIAGADGTGAPTIAADKISLNGRGPNNDHEAFCVTAIRELPYPSARPELAGWGFCKTAHKPYDVVVCACLTYLGSCWGLEVSSDGDPEEWEDGVALAEQALSREFANPLIVEILKGEG